MGNFLLKNVLRASRDVTQPKKNRGRETTPSPVFFTRTPVRLPAPVAGLPRLRLFCSPAALLRVALLWIAR
jgi:hypothetical protein